MGGDSDSENLSLGVLTETNIVSFRIPWVSLGLLGGGQDTL